MIWTARPEKSCLAVIARTILLCAGLLSGGGSVVAQTAGPQPAPAQTTQTIGPPPAPLTKSQTAGQSSGAKSITASGSAATQLDYAAWEQLAQRAERTIGDPATSNSGLELVRGQLVDWRAKGHQVELVGREKLATGEADKLKVTLKGGAVRYDWVDVASRQIVRTDVTRIVYGRPAALTNLFSEFREAGGIVFPHRIQSSAPDRPRTLTIAVEKIELDPALDAARFRFPD